MDFFESVNRRYTYRGQFASTPVPAEDVEKMLAAAIAAPIGMKVQTGSYVVVDDPAILTQLHQILNRYGSAPLMLVMLSQDMETKYNFEIENYSAAAENILLAVTALGYATVWTDGTLRNPQVNDAIRQLLNIPSEKTIRAVLPIGIPTDPGQPIPKATIPDLVVYNKF